MFSLGKAGAALLGRSDPDPVEVVNRDGGSFLLLVCEHAGRMTPSGLGNLGIAAAEMDRHVAYDIGAEALSRILSASLNAPLVLQRYSRLVVDCNRPLAASDCIPEISDGTTIPANCNLTQAERMLRFEEIHRPFHDTVARLLDERRRDGRHAILVTVHSFAPRFANKERPWQIGICSNRDHSFAQQFTDAFAAANPAISAARNQPYAVDDLSDYTIPVHGESRKLPHVLLEVRNDQITHARGRRRWAQLIGDALRRAASTHVGKEHAGGA